jgi:predicted nucleic acid-binding protein
MRLLLDVNVLLDCLILESSGVPRVGKEASAWILDLCDCGHHQGLVAWHTLPIISYYYGRQNPVDHTAALMDALLRVVDVPNVGHADALAWRSHGIADFEDALQAAGAVAGQADFIVTRNVDDFVGSPVPALTPEAFLMAHT